MTCMKSKPDWFHPFLCPASPEPSLVSLGELFFFFNFGCTRSSLLLRTSLFAASRGCSVISVHWLFNPMLLLMQTTGSKHSDSVVVDHQLVALGHFERLLLNHAKTPLFLAPRGEKFNLGPETRLDHSELLCNAAMSLQPYPTPCNPIDGRPPGSPNPGILQARPLEWVAISFSNFKKFY